MAENSHAHASNASYFYGPSVTFNLQSLQQGQINATGPSEGEVSPHAGGREALGGSPLLHSAVTALVSRLYRKKGLDLTLFANHSVFWATHEVAQAPTSEVCRLPLSKRQEESHKTLAEEARRERGVSVSCIPEEALQSLNTRPPQNTSAGDSRDKPAELLQAKRRDAAVTLLLQQLQKALPVRPANRRSTELRGTFAVHLICTAPCWEHLPATEGLEDIQVCGSSFKGRAAGMW